MSGKMPAFVLKRYEKMLLDVAAPAHIHEMIDNFHNAAIHPNQADFEMLKMTVDKILRSEVYEKMS